MEKSFLNNITWKKIIWFWIILTCTTLFIIYAILNRDPSKLLLNHLESRYDKEFVIVYDGKRSDGIGSWYEAEIYPKELIGTIKENDTYYWAKGFVEAGEVGDTYGQVLLKESANKFYLSKLEELFGKNVLPVIEIDDKFCKFTDFEKELEDLKKINAPMPISGGIYIFGRVENDKDREWYRKQIYEFVQFMKETGTFEYVDLDILVVDSRELISTPRKLLENLPKNLSVEEWRKQRRVLMKAGNKEFNNMTQEELSEKINSINKSEYLKEFYGGLLGIKVYSPKYIKSQGLDNREVREYNSITDVRFDWEMW